MRKPRRAVTEAEVELIMGYLKEGVAPTQIGKILKRDKGIILRIAEKNRKQLSDAVKTRIKCKNPDLEDGLTAYSRYVKSEKRQEALSKTMDKVMRILEGENTPAKDIRDLTISLGIIVDKFAVETGKSGDGAKKALIGMFQKMEQNVTINGAPGMGPEVITNGSTDTDGKASTVYNDTSETIKYPVRELEEQ